MKKLSSALVLIALVTTVAFAPPAQAQIVNGGFEKGDLTGWGTADFINLIYGPSSLLVTLSLPPPISPALPLFPAGTSPTDGIYSFHAYSFAPPGPPISLSIFQDLVIPENATFLTYSFHGAWDFMSFFAGAPGLFDAEIQPSGGGPPLAATPPLVAVPFTYVPDSGLTNASLDLSAFRGGLFRVALVLTPALPQPAPFIVDVDNVVIQTAPIVKGFFPTNAARDIQLNQPISVTFSTNILFSTISSNSFQVRGDLGTSYAGVYSVFSNTVTFTPSTPYKRGDLITVTLNSNLTDGASAPLLFPHTFQFFAEAEGCGFGQFSFSAGQTMGESGVDVDLGDLNGDGRVDAFVSGFFAPNVVYLNVGNGIFTTNQFLAGSAPQRTDLGDLDGDGDLDAFVAENGSPDQVYLNNGSGLFITNQTLGSTELSVGVDLGDVDGDGDMDALVTVSSGSVLVYLNDGTGTFTTNQELSSSAGFAVDLGDLDADGDLDALVVSSATNDVVYLNNGSGMFSTNQFLAATGDWDVDLGDLDGDGDLDAVAAGVFGPTLVYRNNGNGTFATNQALAVAGGGTEVGDLDGDGDLDAIIVPFGGSPQALINDGSGMYSLGPLLAGIGAAGVDLADLDGDGDLDAFVAGSPNTVSFNDELCFRVTNAIPTHALFGVFKSTDARAFFNDGQKNSTVDATTFKIWGKQTGFYTGTYTFGTAAVALQPSPSLKFGEEVVVMLSSNILSTNALPLKPHAYQFQAEVRGCDTFRLQDSGQTLDSLSGYGVALGDVDGDGDVDAYIANGGDLGGQMNRLWLNQGNGTFTNSGQTLGFTASMAVRLGDLDSDGDLDAFIANTFGQGNEVFTNTGTGIFYNSGQVLGSDNSRGVDLGDVDGDGDLDAFVVNGSFGQPDKVYLNDGSAVFTDSGQSLDNNESHNVALGDMDGDGDLDAFIVGGRFSAAPNTVWLNNGQGLFTDSGQILGAGDTSWGVALGDLDADGDLDAFVASWNGAPDRVYLNNGYAVFTDSGQTLGSGNDLSVALGDMDGDGDLDAFVGEYNGSYSQLFLNDGFGVFSDSGQLVGNDYSYCVALADLDGDGTLDAFLANYFAADRVFMNRHFPNPIPIFAAQGSPVVTGDPPGQNFVGDNFDLNTVGGAAQTEDQCGFGTFGQVYINYDATNLYVGAIGLDVAGDNNAAIIFLGMNTLSDNATNLNVFSGTPNGVGVMDNLKFSPAMDLAILIGDEYGDGNYFNFGLEGGQDVGQGVYYMPSGAGTFSAVPNAQLSQFDGVGTVATVSVDDDAPNRQTDRWEVRIPWSNINAIAGINSISNLYISGVVVGGTSGSNRFLSGNYLGEDASSEAPFDLFKNYGFSNVTLLGRPVNLPYQDYDGDGMPNGYELNFALNPTNPADASDNNDSDSFNNLEEYISETNPTNTTSHFKLTAISNISPRRVEYSPSSSNRVYTLEYITNPVTGTWTNLPGQTDVTGAGAPLSTLNDTNPAAATRSYRIHVKLP